MNKKYIVVIIIQFVVILIIGMMIFMRQNRNLDVVNANFLKVSETFFKNEIKSKEVRIKKMGKFMEKADKNFVEIYRSQILFNAIDATSIFGKNVNFHIYISPDNTGEKREKYIHYTPNSKRSHYGEIYHDNKFENILLFDMPPFKSKPVTFYVQEYIFKDTVFYNELCTMLMSDTRLLNRNKKIEGDVFFLSYSDTLLSSFEWFGSQYQYNFSVSAESFGVMNIKNLADKVIGICKILDKDCLIWASTPKEIISRLFTETSKKRKYTYMENDGIGAVGGYTSWNMLLHENNRLELKGTEFCE